MLQRFVILTWLALATRDAFAFQPSSSSSKTTKLSSSQQQEQQQHLETNRADFLKIALVAATTTTTTSAALLFTPFTEPAIARGRATLEYAYDRYTPRIIAGGEFYAKDLRSYIERNDYQAIKAALAEPPKRTKEDKAKIDGGIPERAAQAGGFSDARVLTACDLYAASFSDNSVSTKTKNMKTQVDKLRSIVQEMETTAKIALGEESPGGGFFGFGAKKPTKDELAKKMRSLYVEGGNTWNQFIFAANAELPIKLKWDRII